ncbi:MAG: Spy/CpxP family protein refolding chaperone [Sulfuritalea sp.]|nr:Spy/CpxP family protein refolding chaperone [Sulfuritalea sp.]
MSTSKFRKGAIGIAIAAGLATAFVAVAHPGFGGHGQGYGPGMMGRGGPGMMMGGSGPGMMGWGHGRMFASNDTDVAKFQQERFGELKSQLAITAEQQPAWDAFAAKAAEQAKTMQALRNDTGTATTPERMQQRQKAMTSMSESLARLYEALTPKQREVFDRSHGPMQRRG